MFRFAVDALQVLHTVLDETRLTLEDLSWVSAIRPTAASSTTASSSAGRPGKIYKNMDRHGNTSAASIPVALNELAESGH